MLRKSLMAVGAQNVHATNGIVVAGLLVHAVLCLSPLKRDGVVEAATTVHSAEGKTVPAKNLLRIEKDEQTRVIRVYREDGKAPILTENAYDDTRPYIHPIATPDGRGVLTEFRPWHHPHQMGIFWGDGKAPILTENAYDDTRPYIHPIATPDGRGVLTEFRPWHHPHQMGIFW